MNKEIILKVPLLHQPKDSFHCAVASIRMIMAYNGEVLSHDELIKKFPQINNTRVGITPATAHFLVESGYDVTYRTHQSEIFGEELEDKTEKDLKLFKKKSESLESGSKIKLQLELIIKFIESGGKFSTKLPTLNHIDLYLERKIPVRVGINPSLLHSDPMYKFKHAVVISGKKDNEYLISDPATQFAKPYWVKKDKLLDAWYANGALMLTATKK